SSAQVTVTAILINILNPKLSIFFLAFLPQFVSVDESNPLARMLLLSAAFMLMTFVVFVGYGLFAASIRDHVISRPRVLTWMRRTFAAAFVALGARLAFADREGRRKEQWPDSCSARSRSSPAPATASAAASPRCSPRKAPRPCWWRGAPSSWRRSRP